MSQHDNLPPPAILGAYGLEGAAVAPLGSGLINRTFVVATPAGRRVLQCVNPIFPPVVNEDIAAVTAHLRARGVPAPELLPTTDGALWVEAGGGAWRLMTFIDGVTHEHFATPGQAREAGALLARFHRALDGLRHDFRNRRPGVHDLARHLAALREALEVHRSHARHGEVAPVAAGILDLAGELPPLPSLPPRIVHGDPKAANLLFDRETGRGLALVDLDTLGAMALPLELGDAFRSWCNPAGEDSATNEFSLALFAAAVEGYAAGSRGWITPAEQAALVPATIGICVELAARFCADALNERYFGWDPARFESRGAHNLVRARGQLALARSLAASRAGAEAAVAAAFRGGAERA